MRRCLPRGSAINLWCLLLPRPMFIPRLAPTMEWDTAASNHIGRSRRQGAQCRYHGYWPTTKKSGQPGLCGLFHRHCWLIKTGIHNQMCTCKLVFEQCHNPGIKCRWNKSSPMKKSNCSGPRGFWGKVLQNHLSPVRILKAAADFTSIKSLADWDFTPAGQGQIEVNTCLCTDGPTFQNLFIK